MAANGQACATCGALAQVETQLGEIFAYHCLSHSSAVGVATDSFAQEAPAAADTVLPANAGGPSPDPTPIATAVIASTEGA
jgi:hypothetical protein